VKLIVITWTAETGELSVDESSESLSVIRAAHLFIGRGESSYSLHNSVAIGDHN
jgi:hypothetical protein